MSEHHGHHIASAKQLWGIGIALLMRFNGNRSWIGLALAFRHSNGHNVALTSIFGYRFLHGPILGHKFNHAANWRTGLLYSYGQHNLTRYAMPRRCSTILLSGRPTPHRPKRSHRKRHPGSPMGALRLFELHWIETGDLWLDGGAMFGVVPKALWSRQLTPTTKPHL